MKKYVKVKKKKKKKKKKLFYNLFYSNKTGHYEFINFLKNLINSIGMVI